MKISSSLSFALFLAAVTSATAHWGSESQSHYGSRSQGNSRRPCSPFTKRGWGRVSRRHHRGNNSGLDNILSEIVSFPLYAGSNSLFRQMERQLERAGLYDFRYDVEETDTTFEVTLEVPGMEAKDLTIEVEEKDRKELRITGVRRYKARKEERADDRENDDVAVSVPTTSVRTEMEEREITQVFELGDTVDTDNMKVTLRAGILRIVAPKSSIARRVKKILIEEPSEQEDVVLTEQIKNENNEKQLHTKDD